MCTDGKNSWNHTMEIEDFSINETLTQAAQQILDHSFAIYRVNEELVKKIRLAHHSAVQFFRQIESREASDEGTLVLSPIQCHNNQMPSYPCQRIVDGNLYGFNIPSPAKKLFRAFCGSPHQPWPTDAKFQRHSTNLADELHQLLIDCTKEIRKEFLCRRQQTFSKSDDSCLPPTKRSRIETESPSTVTGQESHDERLLSEASFPRRGCPLDYFFYHNQNTRQVNCSEHVDRGVLIVVCLTNVPGLELLPRYNRRHGDGDESRTQLLQPYVCPETLVHNTNLYREVSDPCSEYLAIMAGDQLAEVLKTSSITNLNGMDKETDEMMRDQDFPKATVHRVKRYLARARLSITYELRSAR